MCLKAFYTSLRNVKLNGNENNDILKDAITKPIIRIIIDIERFEITLQYIVNNISTEEILYNYIFI